MRVLLVTITLGLGGSERQLALLARELHRRQIQVKVFALDAEGPWLDRLRSWGVPIVDGRFGGGGGQRAIRFLRLARTTLRLAGTVLLFRPTILHSYLPLANFLASVVGSALRVSGVINSRRGLGTYRDAYPSWDRLDRVAYRFSACTVCNSKAVLEDSVRRDQLGRDKYQVIYNGIESIGTVHTARRREELRAQMRLGDRDVALVTVANLIPYKGHEELLAAFQSVATVNPTARLVLAGEDRDNWKQRLDSLVQSLGISGKVIFLGHCEDIPSLLSAMDIAVVSSREEGFSNALLEALEAGLPVIATDVGGNREALEEGRLGVLVPPQDAPALVNAINTMIADLDHWRKAANEASAIVRGRYSVEAMVAAHLDLYSSVGGTAAGSTPSGVN